MSQNFFIIEKNKINALIDSTYPRKYPLALFAIAGSVMVGAPIHYAIKAVIAMLLALMSVMLINVVSDWEYDKINKKNILAQKYLSKNGLICFYFVLIFLSLSLTINENFYFFVCVLLEILAGLFYSFFRLKDVFILNYVLLGTIYGFLPVCAGIFVFTDAVTQLQMIVALLSFLFLFFGVQIKDFEDVAGDKKFSTLPLVFGKYAQRIYLAYHIFYFCLIGFLILSSVLPFKFIIAFLAVPYVIGFMIRFMKAESREEYRKLHIEHRNIAITVIFAFSLCFII